jgi:hypothetical protein
VQVGAEVTKGLVDLAFDPLSGRGEAEARRRFSGRARMGIEGRSCSSAPGLWRWLQRLLRCLKPLSLARVQPPTPGRLIHRTIVRAYLPQQIFTVGK